MRTALLIGFAGALGTLARYGLASALSAALGAAFPWATLLVNVLGCFAFGVAIQAAGAHVLSPELRAVVTVGFLGAFTTFSTFAFESLDHAQHGRWPVALGNIALSVVLGVTAAWLGIQLARSVWAIA